MKLDFADDKITIQLMKYKFSLWPDYQILSQSMKYKSNLTSSSTNELCFNTTYLIFFSFSLKNSGTLSCREWHYLNFTKICTLRIIIL